MLGCLSDYPLAEVYKFKGVFDENLEWSVAIHKNDINDTISYHSCYTKDEAIEYARRKGFRDDQIIVTGEENGHVKVEFTCAACGRKFEYGGGMLSRWTGTRTEKCPICFECCENLFKGKKKK